MRKERWFALAMGLSGLLTTFGAAAQDAAVAMMLFDRAIAALDRGDVASACTDFAESQRLVPQLGTLFQLAKCEATAGKIASASAYYHQFLTNVHALPDDKQPKYKTRIDEAEAAKVSFVGEIPTLTLVLPANAPADTVITRDGTTLTRVMLGIAMPVDPGEHVVTTQVLGGPLHEQRFDVARKETKTVELEVKLAPPLLTKPKVSVDETNSAVSVEPVRVDQGVDRLRVGGFVGLGVGVAGFVAASVAGGVAMSKKSFVEENCPTDPCANPSASSAAREAFGAGKTAASVATAGLVVGVVGLLAGGVMVLSGGSRTAPAQAKSGVQVVVLDVSLSGGMFGVQGVFR